MFLGASVNGQENLFVWRNCSSLGINWEFFQSNLDDGGQQINQGYLSIRSVHWKELNRHVLDGCVNPIINFLFPFVQSETFPISFLRMKIVLIFPL